MHFIFTWTVSLLVALVSCSPTIRQDSGKPIFAHYMIGFITREHTRQDIVDAKSLGLDAFALNINSLQPWATDTVNNLFSDADELGFGLFFSFDHGSSDYFTDPNQYAEYLKPFLSRASYFKYNGKALVSTFGAEAVTNDQWSSFKNAVGDVLVIPGFYQATPSPNFFDDRASLDGVFNWNSWANPAAGKVEVPDSDDQTYLSAARNSNKLFIMGISPIQFKHIDSNQNWYVRGESNLEIRLGQTLSLQPDMIELQTWNDAGESHYMGNIWPEPIDGGPIGGYVDEYDHKGYWQILPAFIQAWKRGDTGDTGTEGMVPTNGGDVQGVFWHHTVTVDADCAADGLGKPRDISNAENAVSGVVLVAEGKTGLVAVISNGDKELGRNDLAEGYNKFKFGGIGAGKVKVEILDGRNMIAGGSGPLEVSTSAPLCNYNFQVVGFPA